MKSSEATTIQLFIRNEELSKHLGNNSLQSYIKDVVVPLIHESLITQPKGIGGEIHGGCDRTGCSVGGSIRF